MNKKELIATVSKKITMDPAEVSKMLEIMLTTIQQNLVTHHRISLSSFGIFKVVSSRNKNKVRFVPSISLKTLVNTNDNPAEPATPLTATLHPETETNDLEQDVLPTSVKDINLLTKVPLVQQPVLWEQAYNVTQDFPDNWISEHWNGGYFLTSGSYLNGLWAIVMSKTDSPGEQCWKLTEEWPAEWIQEKWNDGYQITQVIGDRPMLVVMSRDALSQDQIWYHSIDFPAGWIQEKWNDGYSLTVAGQHWNQWTFVMSRNARFHDQRLLREPQFSQQLFEEYQRQDDFITAIGCSSNELCTVTTRNTGWNHQVWSISREFPHDWVRDQWNQKMQITTLGVVQGQWFVLLSGR
ncbi:MAG: HU family DNA-binding protein [SAR324 cluster bacterium]|nr:HU family DNA-binding protein [SAR324 cluster bacterium]